MAFFQWLERTGVTLHPGGWAATQRMLAQLQLRAGERVLDLGCGSGRTLAYVVRQFRLQAVGVDLMPALAAQSYQRVRPYGGFALAADILRLPFRAATFDAAWAESVFVFLPKPEAFQEAARVLKPQGRLGMIELAWRSEPIPEYCEQTRQFLQVPRYEVLTLQEWSKMLQAAGFTVGYTEKLSAHAAFSPLPFWLSDTWALLRLAFGLARQVPLARWREGAVKIASLFRSTVPAIFIATKVG